MAKSGVDTPQYKAFQHSLHGICKDISKLPDAIPQLAKDLQEEKLIIEYKPSGKSPYSEASGLVTPVLTAVKENSEKLYVFAKKLNDRGFTKAHEELMKECVKLGGSGGDVTVPESAMDKFTHPLSLPVSKNHSSTRSSGNDSQKDSKSIGFDGLFKDKYAYNITNKPGHGVALIINNEKWIDGKRASRLGSAIDVKNFRKTVEHLNYTVIEKIDLTAAQMKKEVEEAGKSITQSHDSFICCIMSHGDNIGIEGVDLGVVTVEELAQLVGPEKCPNLANKPKIFILQACRGQELTQQVLFDDMSEPEPEEFEPQEGEGEIQFDSGNMAIPPGADYLFAYCTTPRTKALRHTTQGAFYMQILCDKLKKKAGQKMGLYDIILRVHDKLATDDSYMYERKGKTYRQMGQVVSTLRKKVYFK